MTDGTGCSPVHVGAEVGGRTGKMYRINVGNGNGLRGGIEEDSSLTRSTGGLKRSERIRRESLGWEKYQWYLEVATATRSR